MVSSPLESLGNITGLHIGTGGVNWRTPNPNLGDLWNVGSMFSPGGAFKNIGGMSLGNFGTSSLLGASGLGGLANPGKMQPMDWLKMGSRASAMGQQGGGMGYTMPGSNLSNQDMIGSLLGQAYGPSMMEGAFNQGASQRRLMDLQRAHDALDPSNFMASIDEYGRSATAGAQQNAKRFANSSPNLASGAREGAELDALNQGNMATNQYAQGLLNPFAQAKAYQAQSDLYSPQNVLANFSTLAALLGLNNNQRYSDMQAQAMRPPSLLESGVSAFGPGIYDWANRQIFGSQGYQGASDPLAQYRYMDVNPDYFDDGTDWRSDSNILRNG